MYRPTAKVIIQLSAISRSFNISQQNNVCSTFKQPRHKDTTPFRSKGSLGHFAPSQVVQSEVNAIELC